MRLAARLGALTVALVALLPAAGSAAAASLVVTHTGDSGPGSLRQALADAAADPGANAIVFNIPTSDPGFNGRWFTISPLSELPYLGSDTTLDGATQTSFSGDTNAAGPEVELTGASTTNAGGLFVMGSESTVGGLALHSFSAGAIRIQGSRNLVADSYVGTDPTGAIVGNVGTGIAILGAGSRENRILDNLLRGNRPGMILQGDAGVVQGNRVELSGPQPAPAGCGQGGGIFVNGDGNLVGGPDAGEGNVVSANGNGGILLEGGSGNVVEGNLVGTDPTGTIANGNRCAGIVLEGSPNRDAVIRGNVASGNAQAGIVIGNALGHTRIEGNRVGTTADGMSALGNGDSGIVVFAGDVTIGGAGPGTGNVISGNAQGGVQAGIPFAGRREVTVIGNLIGTDATGTGAVPNRAGVVFINLSDSTIAGNVISGNLVDGVSLHESSTRIALTGNSIGTNASGTTAIPNLTGIRLAASDSTIGGTGAGDGNLISGNTGMAVAIGGPGNTVAGNLIGTNAAGTAAVPNGGGISLFRGFATPLLTNNVIGGAVAAARNVISGNSGSAITLSGGPAVTGNTIRGNYIGVDATGSGPLGNGVGNPGSYGIGFFAPTADGPHDNLVQSNVIAYNGQGGGGVQVAAGVRNTITGNSIFANSGLGIDLGGNGVNANDPGDADAGPNDLQNHPLLAKAHLKNGRLVVKGEIDTPDPESVLIEVFANAVPSPGGDPSGHGEGAVFLGSGRPKPNGKFSIDLSSVAVGTLVTATATDADGNTSEFSAGVKAG